MSTHTIELPDGLDLFVREQVAVGNFHSPSDYLGAVLTELWKTQEREKLTQLLESRIEAAERGETTPIDAEYFERIKRQVLERLAQKNSP